MDNKNITRRNFLKILGAGTVASTGMLIGCKTKNEQKIEEEYKKQVEPSKGKMTHRQNPKNKDDVSLLGFGMMRLPMKTVKVNGEDKEDIDQEQVNRLVDYAIEYGVNYFDTSPAYCQGKSEKSTGAALHKYPRNSYYVATKLSNFNESTWSREESIKMYHNSMKDLQVDYIDYYLLHGIGMGGMESLNKRYIENGVLDYLLEERKAGRIRNLGFSYHGDIEIGRAHV